MSLVSRILAGALGLAVAAGVAAPAAAEDLTIVSKTVVGKDAPITTTQYFTADKIRTSDGENDTIFDVTSGRIWVLDSKKKEYFEFTRDEMAAAMSQLEQQLSGPALDILAKMGGAKQIEAKVEKVGPARKVAGYDCDTYVTTVADSLRYEVCAAPALTVPPAYFDALKARYAVLGPMAKRFDKSFEEMKKIKGFPLAMTASVNLMMIRQDVRSEATEVKKGPVAASVFAVPAGYTKKDTPFKQMTQK
jgi:uncharacterized protein (DUF2141 family)